MMINRCGGVISGSRKVEDNKSHRESIFHRQWWSTSTMTTHPIHYWQCRQGESTQSAQDRFGPLQRKDWWRLRSTWCSNTHVLLTSSPSDRMQAPQQLFDIVDSSPYTSHDRTNQHRHRWTWSHHTVTWYMFHTYLILILNEDMAEYEIKHYWVGRYWNLSHLYNYRYVTNSKLIWWIF